VQAVLRAATAALANSIAAVIVMAMAMALLMALLALLVARATTVPVMVTVTATGGRVSAVWPLSLTITTLIAIPLHLPQIARRISPSAPAIAVTRIVALVVLVPARIRTDEQQEEGELLRATPGMC
jgi:cellulose synthase/poly-beta-1,6-N-acetylglucosamine synthase-like glycosyltransferase